MNLTVIIPTYNEANNLLELLPLVAWADEILVVDSFSTDNTVAVARQHGAKVISREYGYSASQKNWAIPQAKHEWILLLDADERPSPPLLLEIQTRFLHTPPPPDTVAFWISRQNYFLHQKIRFSGWRGDKVIRLFHRDKCRYEDKNVHAEIIAKDGNVGHLSHKINHYTYRNLAHFLAKMERYAEWSAKDHQHRTPKVRLFHLWLKPAFRFFKHFFLQAGFLDGRVGFMISTIMAWGVFLRYAKLYEMQHRPANP